MKLHNNEIIEKNDKFKSLTLSQQLTGVTALLFNRRSRYFRSHFIFFIIIVGLEFFFALAVLIDKISSSNLLVVGYQVFYLVWLLFMASLVLNIVFRKKSEVNEIREYFLETYGGYSHQEVSTDSKRCDYVSDGNGGKGTETSK